jgi:hypothetical protein
MIHIAENEPTNRRLGLLAGAAMLAALIALPQPALAAEHEKPETTYTRVQLWQVERARWGDFVDMFEKYDVPILEKLMADGAISEWGVDSEVLHHPKGYTHSTWYSADSMGALAKAGEAYIAAWEEMDEESMKALDGDFASMVTKHRDFIIDTGRPPRSRIRGMDLRDTAHPFTGRRDRRR